MEWNRTASRQCELSELSDWIVYDLRRTYLTYAEGLGLPPYPLKGLVNHKQPNSDVTGGCLLLTPERLRGPAQQVEDKLLALTKAKKRRKQRASAEPPEGTGGVVASSL